MRHYSYSKIGLLSFFKTLYYAGLFPTRYLNNWGCCISYDLSHSELDAFFEWHCWHWVWLKVEDNLSPLCVVWSLEVQLQDKLNKNVKEAGKLWRNPRSLWSTWQDKEEGSENCSRHRSPFVLPVWASEVREALQGSPNKRFPKKILCPKSHHFFWIKKI